MSEQKKKWEDRLNPLYFPLFTAIPVEGWLTLKPSPFSDVDITLYIIGVLFLVFAGTVETNSEEGKHRALGYIYLVSALLFGSIGLFKWLT
ncbi:hypothetical protein ACJA3J_04615 [Halobacillus sp. SY10]|uniref:Uncharacterized protein n=2 Tax=Halobacillus TaxID=45667 RepID=A0A1H0VJR6_HALAD|nr:MULTISPECIES: hypothetical protein [Halobacillus]RDY72079.1 hypothetical protein DXT76_04075 [Halobacillus trueperi]SDP78564.1 hypothetical protein SAMN05421677_13710 [Halobacillus aidingensis]